MNEIYTVTQVNQHIKSLLDGDRALRGITIQGELSNYKQYASGHHYFSLKDSEGTISAVLFRGAASKLRFRPENGLRVLARGSVSGYPRDGKYQLICEQLLPDGQGELNLAFEQLKRRLEQEGLFAPAHKKPLPTCPDSIAVITSGSGAAVHDMLRILRARWPLTTVKIMSVRVQGAEAPAELTGAVRYANRWQVADLIIIGRGGGSMEDLWAFNSERLARALYDSALPVISAVGHEPDVVISDYVADRRAATPSNAAELAVPDQVEVRERLLQLQQRLQRSISRQLQDAQKRLKRCTDSRQLQSPMSYLQDRQLRLDYLTRATVQGFERYLSREKQRLARASAALDAMSPLKVLARGYAVATLPGGSVLSEAAQVQPGDTLQLRLHRGSLRCTVTERSEN